tara:strand:- start:2458 stop:2733 length:276 start_codon:yes stop_codon:yes gene_type:complete
LERERELFLSSFGCLSNDFSFIKEYLLHTVVVALESNALSFFREKERKKELKRGEEEEEEEENTRTTLVVVLVVFQSFLGFGFHDFVDAKR